MCHKTRTKTRIENQKATSSKPEGFKKKSYWFTHHVQVVPNNSKKCWRNSGEVHRESHGRDPQQNPSYAGIVAAVALVFAAQMKWISFFSKTKVTKPTQAYENHKEKVGKKNQLNHQTLPKKQVTAQHQLKKWWMYIHSHIYIYIYIHIYIYSYQHHTNNQPTPLKEKTVLFTCPFHRSFHLPVSPVPPPAPPLQCHQSCRRIFRLWNCQMTGPRPCEWPVGVWTDGWLGASQDGSTDTWCP